MTPPEPHTYRFFMQPPRLSWVCRTAAPRGDNAGCEGQPDPHRTALLTQVGSRFGRKLSRSFRRNESQA